jgi:putative PIN family toxin of toxin-antitoxin system
MNSKGRFVFDTNTIVSGFLFVQSKPGQALQEALGRGELLLSIETAQELSEVMRRDKFDGYVQRRKREEFLGAVIGKSFFVEVTEHIQVCRDPKDDKFLELAVSGGAECIVSGDDDLLELSPFRGILILTADEFLNWIESSPGTPASSQ